MHDFADRNGDIFLSQNSPLSLTARHDSRVTDLGFCSRLFVLTIALYCRNWFVYYQRCFCCSYYSLFMFFSFVFVLSFICRHHCFEIPFPVCCRWMSSLLPEKTCANSMKFQNQFLILQIFDCFLIFIFLCSFACHLNSSVKL